MQGILLSQWGKAKNEGTKKDSGESDCEAREHASEPPQALLRPLHFVYLVDDYGEGLAGSYSAAVVPHFSAPFYHFFNLFPFLFLRLNIFLAAVRAILPTFPCGLCHVGLCDVLLFQVAEAALYIGKCLLWKERLIPWNIL